MLRTVAANLRRSSPSLSASPLASFRLFSSAAADATRQPTRISTTFPRDRRITAPPMVYIAGEEMTSYTMQLLIHKWVTPHFDIGHQLNPYLAPVAAQLKEAAADVHVSEFTTDDKRGWQFFDLSCRARDASNDKVLADAVAAGAEVGAIFKEPTITPTAGQQKEMGLSQSLPSPNGLMRKGWNGVTISRDTIHIEGVPLGFRKPVLFERHAVGGEYGAGWKSVGTGRLMTTFFPDDSAESPEIVDARYLKDDDNVAVVYHNPLDNVEALAHYFFQRCLAADKGTGVVPYVVTKKTVFKWQESFWTKHKDIFDKHYKQQFQDKGLLASTGGELQHLISDAATMQIIRWTQGGFGMSAHNYDGDMLTDEISQVHRSPGFITSNLTGVRADGSYIKEFEASHGTVSDLWHMHLNGEQTSMNPLGLAEALMGAMSHAAAQCDDHDVRAHTEEYVEHLRTALHNTFRNGEGTRDIAGENGLTTEQFVQRVAGRLNRYLGKGDDNSDIAQRDAAAVAAAAAKRRHRADAKAVAANDADSSDSESDSDDDADAMFNAKASAKKVEDVDEVRLKEMFAQYDVDNDGQISLSEFNTMMMKLGLAPMKTLKSEERENAHK